MPHQPTARAVHVDRPLTNIAVAYMRGGNYVADQVFPPVSVAKQSDQYFKYTRADWLRSQAEQRAPATESAGSGWNLETDQYYAHVDAIHKDVADQQRANQDQPIDLDRDATRWTTRQILLNREKKWSDAYFQADVWEHDLEGVGSSPSTDQFLRWDESGSDPIGDVDANRIRVMETTGEEVNTGVISPWVLNALRNHEDIIDRIKYTQQGMVTTGLLASMFDLDRLLIASAIEDTSTEGAAEDNTHFINGRHALFVYAAPAPSIMEPSGGYTFVWTGLTGSVQGWQVKRFRMEHLEADRVETQSAYDLKLVAADVGVFFQNAVS